MAKLVFTGCLCTILGISVFLSYGTQTVLQRWQLLNTPTQGINKFLPDDVNSAISCLKRVDAKNYRSIGEIQNFWQYYQRLAEGAWPIRFDEKAEIIVSKAADINCANFSLICVEGAIRVGICHL